MISRVIQIIIVLMLTASCAQNNKNYKANEASNLNDDIMKEWLSFPKKHIQQNAPLCKMLPTKYAKAEQQFKKVKDNISYKFQAGIITGIYRYTALRTNCSTDFLNKNPSMFNLDGKPKTSEYNGAGVVYFMHGEMIGFLTEGSRLDHLELEYMESLSLVVLYIISIFNDTGVDAEIKSNFIRVMSILVKEKQFFEYYDLPLK